MSSNQSNPKVISTSKVIRSTWVEFEDDWFAQGASRYAYKGTFHGDPRFEGKPFVVKVYKDEWYKRLSEYAWKAEHRAFRKADEMAQLFNNKYNTSKPIQFAQPEFTRVEIPIDTSSDTRADTHADTRAVSRACVPLKHRSFNLMKIIGKGKLADTSDRDSNIIPKNTIIAVERYLEGDYVKFNSNTGYVNNDDIASPKAFSHFTYHESNGTILVCDLQGVRTSTGYMFSDPAVLSGDTELGVYGPTDLGKFGIVKFFENHRCNYLCERLMKPKIADDSSHDSKTLNTILDEMPTQARASTYTCQLSFFPGKANELQNKLKLEAIFDDPIQPTKIQSGYPTDMIAGATERPGHPTKIPVQPSERPLQPSEMLLNPTERQFNPPPNRSIPQKDQSVPQKDQSNRQKDQCDSNRDQSNPQQDQSKPGKGQSIPQKGQSNPQKDQSNSNKDQPNQQKDQSKSNKDQSNRQKDPSNSNKYQSNPQRGHSTPQTNQSIPKKGQSNPQKDQSNAHHDQSNPLKDQFNPLKDQSIKQRPAHSTEYECSPQTNQSIPQKDQPIPQRDQSIPQKD